VADLYGHDAVLLPTVSNEVRGPCLGVPAILCTVNSIEMECLLSHYSNVLLWLTCTVMMRCCRPLSPTR
jgi:hypothetical protein